MPEEKNKSINIEPELTPANLDADDYEDKTSLLDSIDDEAVIDAIEKNDFDAFYDMVKAEIDYGSAQEIFLAARREINDVEPEDLDEAALTLSQRRQRGRVMKRMKSRMRVAKRIASKRKASPEKLKQRAVRAARTQIKKKLAAQRDYSSLTPSEKVMVDKRMSRVSKTRLDTIARKLLPAVRKKEMERVAKRVSGATQANESFEINESELAGGQDLDMFIEETILALQESGTCDLITRSQIKTMEKVVDSLFKKFNIDFKFTNHFADRMSDPRNKPCISLEDLANFVKKIYAAVKKDQKTLHKHTDVEVVLKDLQQDLNIPAAIEYDRKSDELVVATKTVMRKKKFLSSSPSVNFK